MSFPISDGCWCIGARFACKIGIAPGPSTDSSGKLITDWFDDDRARAEAVEARPSLSAFFRFL
ncbi:hypothetical protein FBU59_000711 [Linderina macrospora]|uniref:Uncharacterized protein n=1 Tax=Linderina macrospora TaxID=4868 RepID=A0ACC1JG62_9FUNG|nr:hypothetical protein FBU59_000711 [Linderina macrospora]